MADQRNPGKPILAEAVDRKSPQKTPGRWMFVGLICFLFFLAAVVLSPPGERKIPPARHGNGVFAHAMAKQFVADTLLSPASAEFPRAPDEVEGQPGGRWIVRSHVDSQNVYGAMIRQHYVCEVSTRDGTNWNLIDLKFAP